jgi:starvation-inducible DNA-binding protein
MPTSKQNDQRKHIAEKLGDVLASSYVLTLKTHSYHWNVVGPDFRTLHLLFEEQYQEIFAATDVIAERIRALDQPAPGSFAAFAKLSRISEAPGDPPDDEQMVTDLAKDSAILSALCAEVRAIADDAGDTATGDLMNGRIAAHDKAAWMLRAQLA